MEFLLQMGADVQAKDKGGLVPLHNACSYGHLEVVIALVTNGANVNSADLWKFTPLHEAAAKGKYEICKILLEHGADSHRKNRDGQTPLDLDRARTVYYNSVFSNVAHVFEFFFKGT